MSEGLNRVGDFKGGNPVPATQAKYDSNPVNWTPSTAKFGNTIPIPAPVDPKTVVNWTPSPKHFGNNV